MRNANKHILFLVTEFDAPGMRPYARNIINTTWQMGDRVLVVSRRQNDSQAFPGISASSITWIDYPNRKWDKLVFRFRPTAVLNAIDDIIERHNIDIIYSLTEELILARHIQRLCRRIPVLYTVHDACFHDSKFSSLGTWLKHRFIIARPQRQMLEHTCHQVTNSRDQQELIQGRFPNHDVHYAPFPTLVTDVIAQGNCRVPELSDIDGGYILFFGNVQLYKGVHMLYDVYLSHPELRRIPLVIAGSGDIYFKRSAEEQNVIFINRFIDDNEVADLFNRAAVVVYPYISATQSGVTSIASYFGKPMVLSDLPFFRQTCDGYDGIQFFPTGDTNALTQAIVHSLQAGASTRPLYDNCYTTEALRTTLATILNDVINRK